MSDMERAPVRIQVWLSDGVQLDVRGWLDEFTATNEIPPLDLVSWYRPTRHDYIVKAHNGDTDEPWKFERGKPKVAA